MNSNENVLDARRAGILLHPTSLPGSPGNGDFSHPAYRFVDFLSDAGMSIWQTLPLGPTHDDLSPYQCLSVHAGNPLLISLDWLADRKLLGGFDFHTKELSAVELRMSALEWAYHSFHQDMGDGTLVNGYHDFIERESDWLDDFALFMALRNAYPGQSWPDWPIELRDRRTNALADASEKFATEINRVRFEQFVFFEQWKSLRAYASERGVLVFGDMPIYVAHDSAEVWAHREFFTLDAEGQSELVAGVPPDYFSATGQRWGNPLYRWGVMQNDGFRWWVRRMETQLRIFDLIRIDHFRGLEAYWEILANEETAIHGRWVKAPGNALLETLHDAFGELPIIAEDLGTITPEVDALRHSFSIPGMKILQFAFGDGADNPYLPHHHTSDYVVYSGTHDNDTSRAWFETSPKDTQEHVLDYLGYPQEAMPWPLIRSGMASCAKFAIFPMQDILGLGPGHRMNTPGTTEGNWLWRFSKDQTTDELANRLRHLVGLYGRGAP